MNVDNEENEPTPVKAAFEHKLTIEGADHCLTAWCAGWVKASYIGEPLTSAVGTTQ